MTTESFLEEVFGEIEYQPQIAWITPELRSDLEAALDRDFPGIRVRYWSNGTRSAWILEQIGKERLITAGFATELGEIVGAHVLEYRESRGGEVRYDSFLHQFWGIALDGDRQLNSRVDGITGATYSVRSMKQMATAALLLEKHKESADTLP